MDKKLALIGLDTSHSIEFPRRMQGDAETLVDGLKAVTCLRFPSPFQTEEQQDDRQAILEGWDIKVTRDFEEAVEGVDGIMLEINDPAQHWTYFEKVAGLGLPIYIDKPLAKDLADARKIVELAEEKDLAVWEASSLRFSPELNEVAEAAGAPGICNIYGALGIAPAGSSLIWYGCHTFQMLHQIMGEGAKQVQSIETPRGIVSVVEYSDGRQGIVEALYNNYKYGGRVHGENGVIAFEAGGDLYSKLMKAMKGFFHEGTIPVSLRAALEVQATMEAAEQSLELGKPVQVQV